MKAVVRLRRVGDSLVITIPKHLLKQLDFYEGDYIEIETDGPQISRITKVKP